MHAARDRDLSLKSRPHLDRSFDKVRKRFRAARALARTLRRWLRPMADRSSPEYEYYEVSHSPTQPLADPQRCLARAMKALGRPKAAPGSKKHVREKKLKVQMKKDGKKRAKMAAGKLPKRKGNKK